MTKEEMELTTSLLMNLVRQAMILPLDDFLAALNRFEAVGCFTMAPNEWMKGLDQAQELRKMAEAAQALRRYGLDHDERVTRAADNGPDGVK